MAIHRPTISNKTNNNGDTIQRDGQTPFGSSVLITDVPVNRSILFKGQKFYYDNDYRDIAFINSDFVSKTNPITDFGYEHGRQFVYFGKNFIRYEFGGDE